MSQSSCASSSVHSAQAYSTADSLEDVGLFLNIDQDGNRIPIPFIIAPKIKPSLYEFDGNDFTAIEDSILPDVQGYSGGLKVPTRQEARRLREERARWVRQMQIEQRSRWSLDIMERGEAIEMESHQSRGQIGFEEDLRESEGIRWTLAVWLAWAFSMIRAILVEYWR